MKRPKIGIVLENLRDCCKLLRGGGGGGLVVGVAGLELGVVCREMSSLFERPLQASEAEGSKN